ncbi:alpha-glutamyl/putrescinyl thymine pyrophosphorylase clade 3 protein [Cupriavidus basilensis]
MMKEQARAAELSQALRNFRYKGKRLPGIATPADLDTLVAQLIESLHRIDYVTRITNRPVSPQRLDPKSELFDPLRAAVAFKKGGQLEEAFWMVFLFVHFGKDLKHGYSLLRAFYGAFGEKFLWTWKKYSKKPSDFSLWFQPRLPEIEKKRKTLKFGNHRKYESIRQVERVFESYLDWMGGPGGSHIAKINDAMAKAGNDPKAAFDRLYKDMFANVYRFGRTGAFDYLTMVGKLGLAPIEAPSAYMAKATGPARGIRLLFGGSPTFSIPAKDLDALAIQLGAALGVGMQVIEDSLCNWQKSPGKFISFRG